MEDRESSARQWQAEVAHLERSKAGRTIRPQGPFNYPVRHTQVPSTRDPEALKGATLESAGGRPGVGTSRAAVGGATSMYIPMRPRGYRPMALIPQSS